MISDKCWRSLIQQHTREDPTINIALFSETILRVLYVCINVISIKRHGISSHTVINKCYFSLCICKHSVNIYHFRNSRVKSDQTTECNDCIRTSRLCQRTKKIAISSERERSFVEILKSANKHSYIYRVSVVEATRPRGRSNVRNQSLFVTLSLSLKSDE